jgi:hypothetical protein
MIWIALAIVYVGFLYKFPKTTVIVSGVTLLLAVLLFGWSIWSSQYQEKLRAKALSSIVVDASIDIGACSPEKPLRIIVSNNWSKTLASLSLNVISKSRDAYGYGKQAVRLTGSVKPNETGYWCIARRLQFSGAPYLPDLDGTNLKTDIDSWSVRFE